MILYHGTSARRAKRIAAEGFEPRKPSRRVWFAERRGYALGRAKTQARRRHDRPVVLVCEVDLNAMRRRLGPRRVIRRSGVVAISGHVPVTVIRSFPHQDIPTLPGDIAAWFNRVLRLRPYKGVGGRHPGVQRLAEWIAKRLAGRPDAKVQPAELIGLGRRWLPEFFEGVEVDLDRLHVRRKVATISLVTHAAEPIGDEQEEEAFECLDDPRPSRRARGLRLLAELDDPDLFDWCTMFLHDEAPSVRLAALQTMGCCKDGHPEPIRPFAQSANKRIRAAALAALALHGGPDAPGWFRRGLQDPSACVRVRTAKLLPNLEPARHRPLFELALHDPNREVARIARKLTDGRGFGRPRY